MRRTFLAAVLAAVVGTAGALAGCDDNKPEAPKQSTEVSPAQRKLAGDACGDYVARLCACAETKPTLADTCKLKRAKPEALSLALAVVDDPASSADSVARARAEVGKIVARCIEEAAQLPALGCP